MLHSDDHEVVIVREDSDGVTARKGDVIPKFSLIDFREFEGYLFAINTYLAYFL